MSIRNAGLSFRNGIFWLIKLRKFVGKLIVDQLQSQESSIYELS